MELEKIRNFSDGELGTEERGTEQPHLGEVPDSGVGRGLRRRSLARGQVVDELDDVAWKPVSPEIAGASERPGGVRVGARRPPDP